MVGVEGGYRDQPHHINALAVDQWRTSCIFGARREEQVTAAERPTERKRKPPQRLPGSIFSRPLRVLYCVKSDVMMAAHSRCQFPAESCDWTELTLSAILHGDRKMRTWFFWHTITAAYNIKTRAADRRPVHSKVLNFRANQVSGWTPQKANHAVGPSLGLDHQIVRYYGLTSQK